MRWEKPSKKKPPRSFLLGLKALTPSTETDLSFHGVLTVLPPPTALNLSEPTLKLQLRRPCWFHADPVRAEFDHGVPASSARLRASSAVTNFAYATGVNVRSSRGQF